MDDIDEVITPKVEKEEEFRPYFPEKPGQEGVLTKLGLKKKLIRVGEGWEVPEEGDEIMANYTARVLDGDQFATIKDEGKPFVAVIGQENVFQGCKEGLITMRRGEISIFTIPPVVSHGIQKFFPLVPHDATLEIEIELISWLKVVDVCGDGGVLKKILVKSEILEKAQKKDEVTVKYEVQLKDGGIVAKSPEEGVEFPVSEGHLCPAIAKTVITMRKGEKALVQVKPEYAFGTLGRSARDGFCAVPPNSDITISLQLIAYKILEYVTEDMNVVKKIITIGEGFLKPNSGTTAQIRYIGKLGDGKTIFERKGYGNEEPFEFKVDEEQVISGLDLAVATMKKGEFALVKVDPEYGFGTEEVKRELAVVPPNSNLYYEIEMVNFTKVKESWDMNPEEKIEYAGKRKEEGNTYFKAGNHKRASLRYDMAAKYVEFDSTFNEEQKKIGKFFKVTCNLNNAACKLKLKEYREAANLCTKVLKLESENVKALYRRAQAYTEIKDLDLAELDLSKALEIDRENGEAGQLLDKVKKLQALYDKKDSKMFSNMIGKLRTSEPIAS
ncbi:peptidyl-prolyl cis-trans isomerase FKBP65-like [Aristolochia californica]|uniref:peptidyl-prolyl cis-trans isomerase FKBP65-like n=1 Tax=Aristolochia californica TaxID=171875 RepID=UPI0035D9E6F7